MPRTIRVTVEPGEEGQRLDRFLASRIEGVSRSAIQRLLGDGRVLLAGAAMVARHKTHPGEEYLLEVPDPHPAEALAEEIPLNIVFEDRHIVIVNKPAGMVVHPAKGHFGGTLVNALLHLCDNLSGIGGEMRPGIVHRLDKDTSGLIAVAKNDAAHLSLSQQLRSREMGREYLAVVRGVMKECSGVIDKPIGRHTIYRKKMTAHEGKASRSREAITMFETVRKYGNATLVRLKLKTGRTHQIRVHLAAIGHPVVGDTVYGRDRTKLIGRTALHAAKLILVHPATGEKMEFESPLPEDFQELLRALERT